VKIARGKNELPTHNGAAFVRRGDQ